MASGGIARASSRARVKKQVQKNTNTTDKWIGKKFKVSPGDLVSFHSSNVHMLGGMGQVVGYLSKNVVLVRTFGGNDTDYPPMFVGARNQRANMNYAQVDDDDMFSPHYQIFVTGVAHRVNPKPPKKRKPVKFHEVTAEDLPAVLTGEQAIPQGHKVVLLPEQNTPPTP